MADTDPLASGTSRLRSEVADLAGLARGMGSAFTDAFRDGALEGRSFGSVLRDLALRLSQLSLTAAFKPVEGFLGGVLANGFAGLRAAPRATGAAVTAAGAIAAPSYLPAGAVRTAASLAENAGPAGRSPPMPVAGRGATHVTVNIATPDVDGFRRSEAQVSAALARAVARGHRSL